eukprot:CAMPEP_0206207954 /NCGR_PEP_ID=MMETSP0166-20121206/15915_1 /ASSEMBLY_ACC=CAM_ASM_000260 /TAXON_ID=95228 /ORGANISM="Vannella robusta, Strain DIVA3 518/3/11/1/6" /LENGTH=316 /DNA_ID=CAMNT_0053628847 /DNA_START=795 /DNA_END=1740 /DNA_ORIENTATION=+
MRTKYPDVTPEQLAELNDDCAICREPMETAKKLPCSHVFHEHCLRLWLEHHHSCPTCRYQLIGSDNQAVTEENIGEVAPARFGWLRRLFRRRQVNVTPDMINAVREIAPHVPEAWIRQDLARTGSTNATVERIFERFPPPPEPNEEEGEAAKHSSSITPDSIDETIENVTEEVQKLEKRTPTGFRHSSEERENLLRDRKELMKQKGRLAFLRKQGERARSLPMPVPGPDPISELIQRDSVKKQENGLKRESEPTFAQEQPKQDESEHREEKKEPLDSIQETIPGTEDMPSFSLRDSVEIRRKRALLAAERRRLSNS